MSRAHLSRVHHLCHLVQCWTTGYKEAPAVVNSFHQVLEERQTAFIHQGFFVHDDNNFKKKRKERNAGQITSEDFEQKQLSNVT